MATKTLEVGAPATEPATTSGHTPPHPEGWELDELIRRQPDETEERGYWRIARRLIEVYGMSDETVADVHTMCGMTRAASTIRKHRNRNGWVKGDKITDPTPSELERTDEARAMKHEYARQRMAHHADRLDKAIGNAFDILESAQRRALDYDWTLDKDSASALKAHAGNVASLVTAYTRAIDSVHRTTDDTELVDTDRDLKYEDRLGALNEIVRVIAPSAVAELEVLAS